MERRVGTDDSHQHDPGKIVSLGYHLRAHQHIQPSLREILEYSEETLTTGGGISIESSHPKGREAAHELSFDSLGSRPEIPQNRRPAEGACLRPRYDVAAGVAEQKVAAVVKGETYRTVFAFEHVIAGLTPDHSGVAAPVEEKNRLLPGVEHRGGKIKKLRRQP
jgi:hypothetical protein